jgi:hypothetical protein
MYFPPQSGNSKENEEVIAEYIVSYSAYLRFALISITPYSLRLRSARKGQAEAAAKKDAIVIYIYADTISSRFPMENNLRNINIALSVPTGILHRRLDRKEDVDLSSAPLTFGPTPEFAYIFEGSEFSFLGQFTGVAVSLEPTVVLRHDYSPAEALRSSLLSTIPSFSEDNSEAAWKLIDRIFEEVPSIEASGLLKRTITNILFSNSTECAFSPVLDPLSALSRAQGEAFDLGGPAGATLCVHSIPAKLQTIEDRAETKEALQRLQQEEQGHALYTEKDDLVIRYSIAMDDIPYGGDTLFNEAWMEVPEIIPPSLPIFLPYGTS